MDVFEKCAEINTCLTQKNEKEAREKLIKLLDYLERNNISYDPLINHLIRLTGLYPYIKAENADWQDALVSELFKVETGDGFTTLHREQSDVLKKLLNGESIILSAPTSFGKSFIIDGLIALKKPRNIVILVPTIALMDETRKRLLRKFGKEYKIITTPDIDLEEQNLFIFPQERLFSYKEKLTSIDLFIVDEFYKVSNIYDKGRSDNLLKAIMKFEKIAKQRYYLTPNITTIKEMEKNAFIKKMEFIKKLDFNTVVQNIEHLYKDITKNKIKETVFEELIERTRNQKTLIYAGTYNEIKNVSNIAKATFPIKGGSLLTSFSNWLITNYGETYNLSKIITRGVGIHNGRLHRSLSQIQVKLFEETNGLDYIISTSSIIEGVNTSAQNVILWKNKNGKSKLNPLSYKNLIGRSGRMFKYFIGNIYLLDSPKEETEIQLEISFTDSIHGDVDIELDADYINDNHKEKIVKYNVAMTNLFGKKQFNKMKKEDMFQLKDCDMILKIAQNMHDEPIAWNGLRFLNSENENNWDHFLFKCLTFVKNCGTSHTNFVAFIKVLSKSWQKEIPKLLNELQDIIDIDLFFELERNVTFHLFAVLHDINIMYKYMFPDINCDISPFCAKVSHAFLPVIVYQLEEYGLPRMLSKKIQNSNVINLENKEKNIHDAIDAFLSIGIENVLKKTDHFDEFDTYILRNFYDGITINN